MAHSESNEGNNIVVTVVNEDDGQVEKIPAGPGTPVRVVIDRMYELFKRTRKNGDRLRCDANGENIFPHADMHLGEFTSKFCSSLVWKLAGETGGA